jgi:hypothetical protein
MLSSGIYGFYQPVVLFALRLTFDWQLAVGSIACTVGVLRELYSCVCYVRVAYVVNLLDRGRIVRSYVLCVYRGCYAGSDITVSIHLLLLRSCGNAEVLIVQ